MTYRFARSSMLPLALAAVTLAGCGSSASSGAKSSSTSSANPPATVSGQAAATPNVPTPSLPKAPTIKGGSVAAVVNGHRLPMSTYRALLTLTSRQAAGQQGVTSSLIATQSMNHLIVDELIREYAAAHHMTVPAAQINQQIQMGITQLHGQAAFTKRLAELGLTIPLYKELLTASLLGRQVEQKIAPPDTRPQPIARVRHILIMLHPQGKPARTDAQAHALANQILNQIQHGANFAALAQKQSDDTMSGAKGGDLGTVSRGQMVPQFDQASFTLPLHHPTIVKTMYGYHIVDVLSRGTGPANPQVQQQLQRQRFSNWLTQQMRRASIQRIAKVAA